MSLRQSHKGAETYIKMRLMSLCQHHINADSSFSWCGMAHPNLDKILVTFQRQSAANCDSSDNAPFAWIQMQPM
jgi:hypothetical protein